MRIPNEANERRRAQMLELREQGYSLRQIGDAFGVSKQRVHQEIQHLQPRRTSLNLAAGADRRQFYTEIGRVGGEATKRNHGSEHYSRIGRIGGQHRHGGA